MCGRVESRKRKKCIRKKRRRSEQNIERKRETRDIQIRLLLVLVLPYLFGQHLSASQAAYNIHEH